MSSAPVHYRISGTDAATLARSIERGVTLGHLQPGDAVPSVRALAEELGLSPTTIASAYRELRLRGVLVTFDRARTAIAHRPPLTVRLAPDLPPGTIDLATGNPDPTLLPDLAGHLRNLSAEHRLYGNPAAVPRLLDVARQDLDGDGIPREHLSVVGGGLDGIERILQVHCRLGDRIAVEDPGYIGSLDLIRTLGLEPVPVSIDDEGPSIDAMGGALDQGVSAVLLVPRAQNPTGATLTGERATQLREVLAAHPDVLIIEDDHAGSVSGSAYHRSIGDHPRWATIRSLAKSLGPDLRVAIVASDLDTATRVTGRQRLGTGWVSHVLQELAASVWAGATDQGTLVAASARYHERREGLIRALQARDIPAHGVSGLNVWVPVTEEVPVVQGLLHRGWAVQAGEPFRFEAPPGVRITVAALPEAQIEDLATDFASVLDHRLGSRRG